MDEIVFLLRKITPDLIQKLENRYNILRNIQFFQPIGRRVLSAQMNWSERPLRSEVKFLERQGLINIKSGGMELTSEGEKTINKLQNFISRLRGLNDISSFLKNRFQIKDVLIIPGDSDVDESIKKQMGRMTADYLKGIIKDGSIIAVTGGTTVAQIPKVLPDSMVKRNVVVVPGRGALGEKAEIQANTIAAELARKLGGSYKLLHVPDNLSQRALKTVCEDSMIKELLQIIKKADILIHGVGTAQEMAKRRGLSQEDMEYLKKMHAVSETLGFYLDKTGKIVYETTSIGFGFSDLNEIGTIITVAGGSSKAEAILAFLNIRYSSVLITDEGAAKKMINILQEGN